MPKVTVAIPTYNRKEYLKECIESVLAQTFQDFVIFVFDNHSDYDVQAFLDGFNDKRISLFPSPVNTGNCDRVFEYSFHSDYVIIFHDDDAMHPALLDWEVAAMDAHADLVWVGTGLQFVKDHGGMKHFEPIKGGKVFIHDTSGIVRLILQGFNLCFDSAMYRSKYLGEAPLFARYSKWGDRPYLVELSKKGRVGILKEKLVNYRVHPGQDSQGVASNVVQYAINVLLCYKEALGGLRTAADKRLFYSHIVNSLIPSAFSSARTIPEFMKLLEPYRQADLLKMRYLNERGLARTMRTIAGRIKRHA